VYKQRSEHGANYRGSNVFNSRFDILGIHPVYLCIYDPNHKSQIRATCSWEVHTLRAYSFTTYFFFFVNLVLSLCSCSFIYLYLGIRVLNRLWPGQPRNPRPISRKIKRFLCSSRRLDRLNGSNRFLSNGYQGHFPRIKSAGAQR
jgi:hypothetical protein